MPLRQNTTTFTTTPGGPSTLQHGRNLDNNSGPSTFEDATIDNGGDDLISVDEPVASAVVVVAGTYSGTKAGVFGPATLTFGAEIEDIVIDISTTGSLVQGSSVLTTLTISTGEYRDVANVRVRQLSPDGVCPQGSVIIDVTAEASPDWQDGCSGGVDSTIGGVAASYSTARELNDGRVELVWNPFDHPALVSLASDSTLELTYTSTVRPNYREALADAGAVLSGDEVDSGAQVVASDAAIAETDAAADLEPDGTDDGDTATTQFGNSRPTSNLRVAERSGPLASGAFTDATTCATQYDSITWVEGDVAPGVAGYGPGDLVCFESAATFDPGMNVASTLVVNTLPAGFTYVAGSAVRVDAAVSPLSPTPDTLDTTTVVESAVGAEFTLGTSGTVGAAGHQFRWVFGARVLTPADGAAGDQRLHNQLLEHHTSSGEVLQYRDTAITEWAEPQVGLVFGVASVASVAGAVAIVVDQGADADGSHIGAMASTPVQANAEVEFRIDLWNNGSADAVDVEVWSLLAPDMTCAEVSAISDSGTCVGTGSGADPYRVIWTTGVAVGAEFGRADASGANPGSTVLRYSLIVPADVSGDEYFASSARVRTYAAMINGFDDGDVGTDDSRSPYVPLSNIDVLATAPTPNTAAADDASALSTSPLTITQRLQSGIGEAGNTRNATLAITPEQATVGEVVQYELSVTIPEGTSVVDAVLTDALNAALVYAEGSALVDGAATVVGTQVVSVPAAAFDSWVVATPSVGASGTVSVSQPAGTYTNPEGSGDDVLTLTFWVRVDEQPATNHGDVIANTATFSWDNSFGGAQTPIVAASRTVAVREPSVSIVKTHSVPAGNSVTPDDPITWNIAVTNSPTAATAHDTVVVDNLPSGVTITNASAGVVTGVDPEVITWTSAEVPALAQLSPGETVNLEVAVTVDNPATVSVEVRNDADVQLTAWQRSTRRGPAVATPTPTSMCSTCLMRRWRAMLNQ